MMSGTAVVAILEMENAVEAHQKLIGLSDPLKAEEGTIRKLYTNKSTQCYAIHGSDCDENTTIECNFFFGI